MMECELVLVQQGIEIPSRVFVGRIPYTVTDEELHQFFQRFGKIMDAKIVCDRQGMSKGFGFVTFETAEEAQNVMMKGKLKYKSSYINVSKAIRKQGGQFEKANQEYVNGQRQISLLHHYSGDYLLNYEYGLWYAEPLNLFQQPTKPCFSMVPSSPNGYYSPQQIQQQSVLSTPPFAPTAAPHSGSTPLPTPTPMYIPSTVQGTQLTLEEAMIQLSMREKGLQPHPPLVSSRPVSTPALYSSPMPSSSQDSSSFSTHHQHSALSSGGRHRQSRSRNRWHSAASSQPPPVNPIQPVSSSCPTSKRRGLLPSPVERPPLVVLPPTHRQTSTCSHKRNIDMKYYYSKAQ